VPETAGLGHLLSQSLDAAEVNARLYADAARRRREAELVAELARAINASLDLDIVLQRVVESAKELCGSDGVAIALRDAGSDAAVIRYHVGTRYQHYGTLRIEPGAGLGGVALLSGRPVRNSNYLEDPRAAEGCRAAMREEELVAVLVVPIRIGARVEGLLYAGWRSSRPFIDQDEVILLRLADHAGVAIQNARLFAESEHRRKAAESLAERLQTLSRRLVEIQEEERRHLARELHDEIGQLLTGLKLSLQVHRLSLPAADTAALDEAQGLVKELIHRVRKLSLDVRPAMLDDLGLVPALRWHLDRYAAQTQVTVRFEHAGLERRFPPDVETATYRIVQEALTNVARHAGTSQAVVRLWVDQDTLGIQVEDRGVGFALESQAVAHASGGLAGMRERAELLGGRLTVESAPGAGTRLWAVLPRTPPGKGGEP